MQKQFRRLHPPVGVKPALHHAVMQEIGESDQTHALVVGHPATHQFMAMAPGAASGSRAVIGGLVKPVRA